MTENAAWPSDERLVLFLDGALSAEEEARIAQASAQDPSLAQRIEALALDRQELRAQFDSLLTDAPHMTPLAANKPVRPVGFARLCMRAAAVAAIFAAGLGAGLFLSDDRPAQDWTTAVADYQVLYATETLTTMPLAPAARQTSLARTTEALGVELPQTVLSLDGLDFQRAQILSYKSAPLAQLAFLDADGTPYALCFLRSGGEDQPPAVANLSGLASVTWKQQGIGFILIGGDDLDAVARWQREIAGRIGA